MGRNECKIKRKKMSTTKITVLVIINNISPYVKIRRMEIFYATLANMLSQRARDLSNVNKNFQIM